jgi:hypothetical protein
MKPSSTSFKTVALVALACFSAACNPFESLDPTTTSAGGYSGSNDMCAVNRNLGKCPPPPPTDFTY